MSDAATIGHNRPPSTGEILAEKHAGLLVEIDAIADRANKAPKKVKSDTDLDAVGLVVKDAKAMAKRLDAIRTEEKEPHLTAGREVDAYFKSVVERVNRVAEALTGRATEYQREKLAIERRKQEEVARKAREAEDAKRREADELAAAGKAAQAARADAKADVQADKAREAERQQEASNADISRRRGDSGTLATTRTTTKVRILNMADLGLGPLGPYIERDAVQKAANGWLKYTKGQEKLPGLEVWEDVQAAFR